MEQLREAEARAPQLLALLAFSASSCTLRPKSGPKPGSGGSASQTYFPKKDLVWEKKIIVSSPYKPTSVLHIFFVLSRFRPSRFWRGYPVPAQDTRPDNSPTRPGRPAPSRGDLGVSPRAIQRTRPRRRRGLVDLAAADFVSATG